MSDYGTIDMSGTLVTASGVAACRPRALVVYGRSTQSGTPTPSSPVAIESVEAPNLLPRQCSTQTVNGVTFTVNADGSVHAQGTASANAVFYYTPDTTVIGSLPVGTMTLSGCPAGGGASTWKLDFRYQTTESPSGGSFVTDYGSGATFTHTQVTYINITRIVVYSGVTIDATFRPQINLGSTAYPYVPYGNVGLWAKGRNLVRSYVTNSYTYNGITWEYVSEGMIKASGSTGSGSSSGQWKTFDLGVLPAGTYTVTMTPVSGTISGAGLAVSYRTGADASVAGGVLGVSSGGKVTATLTTDGVRHYWLQPYVRENSTATNLVLAMQVQVGAASPFQPYEQTVTPIDLDGHELRSLPDGTRDEVTVDERGHAVLVQRVGTRTFDGTEPYSTERNYYWTSAIAALVDKGKQSTVCMLSDRFQCVANSELNVSTIGSTRLHYTGNVSFNYNGSSSDVNGFKTWLASNPTTLLYPLATPVTHDLGTVDMANLTSPDLTAQTVPSTEFELTALLKTGRTTVMWDGEELSAGWTFVSDRREQLLPTDVATIDVPGRDGALFGGVTRAVRQVTLALYVLGPVGERAPHVRELAARLAVDGPRPLMFSDEAPLYRMAVPNAESDSEVYYDAEGYTDVEFVCTDPWLYGEERSVTVPSGGSVTFTVGGTAPTWPTITASATGSSQGTWILRLDDSSKGVYAAIASGVTRPIVADCDARTLTVNDTTSMLAPSYDWPELTPGTHTLAMTAGTGAATVTWTERWW